MKQIFTIFLAMVMVVLPLAGCAGDSEQQPSTPTQSQSEQSPAAEETGAYPNYSEGFQENVTIEIPVYERAFEGWNVSDNYYTQWVQKEFGDKYNITVKYTPITRASETTDYQQLLAAQQAPDIIFHYDMPQALTYYGEGVMQPLDWDEIAHYAPTYWGNLKETIQQYGTVGNEKVFFFAERPMAYNWITLIRKDWVEKVGMKVEDITSLEVFNEMLFKWKEAGLGVYGTQLINKSFAFFNYPFRDWPMDEKERALYSDLSIADMTTAATERYLRNLNYQYNNGIVDPEFYLRIEEGQIKSEFVAGRTGTYTLYIAANNDTISATLANDPTAEFATLNLRALTPADRKPQERAFWPFGMIMGINYKTTAEERAAVWMYLDWMSQPENLFMFQNGIEGETYTLDENGIAVQVDGYAGEAVLSNNKNKDYWCLVTESAQYDDPEANRLAGIRNWAPAGYESLIEDNMRYYEENAEYSTPDPLFTTVLEKVPEYRADLDALWQELYVQCVLCPEEEFDAKYEAAKQQYLDAGYQEILDEKQAAIDAGLYVYAGH